ncbi:MAG: 2-keto-4-pentenoate hydratase [Arcticibacterium sp.]|jgi:2-keto-4-pentenoate hydratase
MIKNILYTSLFGLLLACGKTTEKTSDKSTERVSDALIDSVYHYRSQHLKTDFLAQNHLDLSEEDAISIQLGMLARELAKGEKHIGWKMAGTVGDSSLFHPLFGYLLAKDSYGEGEAISVQNFPGNEVMIEGEVGFVFNKDFPEGAASLEDLKSGIDYVVGAVEFAQSNALAMTDNPESATTNHALAFGMGQAGSIIGSKKTTFGEYELEAEKVQCFVNDSLAAEGSSARVIGGHLNAVNALVNMLPKYGQKIRKGDVVITGSLYVNPTVKEAVKSRVSFSSLGEIEFEITD